MVSAFQSGPDPLRSDLVTLGQDGPYRLTIRHSRGVIVEYFHTTADALDRQGVLVATNGLMAAVAYNNASVLRTQK
jgi:hypothetical protein